MSALGDQIIGTSDELVGFIDVPEG